MDNTAYALASADLFFTAGIAQNTLFFADIVGLSGAPPDDEIPSLTLINGYKARLVAQNELHLREAWLRTELFGNRLALTAGRLDLTNYFDANAIANDESTQFLSDALVNNQMLGLAVNGTGVATEFDAKNGLRLKFGFQQSNTDATNLSDSMFTLSEVGYTFTPFGLSEGSYRLWFRTDNTEADVLRKGVGLSFDQKLNAAVGLFFRYGQQQTDLDEDDRFYSFGVGFQNGIDLQPRRHVGCRVRADGSGVRRRREADRGLLQPAPHREAAAVVPSLRHSRFAGDGIELQIHLPRHPPAGRVLGGAGVTMFNTYRRKHGGGLLVACTLATAAVTPRRAGRQDCRSDLGRHDREPRLERHRVHGHQDARRWWAACFSATTSTRTW